MMTSMVIQFLTKLMAIFLIFLTTTYQQITEQTYQNESNKPCLSQLYINLIDALSRNITEYWMYKDMFRRREDLGITPDFMQNSMANFGDEKRLKRILIKAILGEDVDLVVIGGSISRGAPFSENGQSLRVYFEEIIRWWRRTIEVITGSTMKAKTISLGGIGSDYYSYCLDAHLADDAIPKLVLWELSANDRGRYDNKQFPKAQPLEQLTRNILNMRCRPALLYLNFFRGHDIYREKDGNMRCVNFEDDGGYKIAQHYRITSISWKSAVCDRIQYDELFRFKNLFSWDNNHPSFLGHAQMAYLIIEYLKTSFTRMLRQHACNTPSFEVFMQQTDEQGDMRIAPALYHETSLENPMCLTYFTIDDIKPNNTLTDVRIIRQDDFHYNIYKKFKIRGDQLGGLQTNISEQLLQYAIYLPRECRRLVIITHGGTGGAQIWVDKNPPIIDNTNNYSMGTKIDIAMTNLKAGQHFLNIFSLQGFALSGIAVI